MNIEEAQDKYRLEQGKITDVIVEECDKIILSAIALNDTSVKFHLNEHKLKNHRDQVVQYLTDNGFTVSDQGNHITISGWAD